MDYHAILPIPLENHPSVSRGRVIFVDSRARVIEWVATTGILNLTHSHTQEIPMRQVRVFIAVFLLLIAVLQTKAQAPHPSKTPRVKVWYSPPSFAVKIGGLSEEAALSSRLESKPLQLPPESGHYVEVDTTTDGTHTTFMVTTTADTGVGSFLKAIMDANANPGLDHIHFSIGSGTVTLAPNIPLGLPLFMSPVVIDGTTQPGYAGTPIIELDGTRLGNYYPGLVLVAGNSTIRGLVLNRFQAPAIRLVSGGNNIIETNFIGTNAAGSDSVPNLAYGVHILNSANNRIGDSLISGRNVIAGNHFPHVMIEGSGSTGNRVIGNFIGTDRTGMVDLSGTTNGVFLYDGPSNNTIGGLGLGTGNLISGNDYPNIALNGTGTSNNIIQGNRIGTGDLALTVMENSHGIYILNGASNNLIGHTTTAGRNIISGSVDDLPGLIIEGPTTTNNVVQGNIIGAPPSATYSFGNWDGVVILQSPNNTIGGTLGGAANWISGNRRNGIRIIGGASTGNRIEGNLIGAPFIPTGSGLLPNLASGINIIDAPGNVIGGAHPQAENSIAGNGGNGIVIQGDTATGNVIRGNRIGTDINGSTDRGNWGHGVFLIASNDTIGGSDPSEGNIIAYNKKIGVYDSSGTNNLIRYNSIFSNDSMGIDLAPRGFTPNDPLDSDEGANGLQNFPILDSASITPTSIRIRGRMNSKPNTTYALDFYRNKKRDATLFGEGETWIGTTTVTCNAFGKADIATTLSVAVPDSHFITATATDPNGNTSEFSRALCMKDTDGDGILDCWETEGLDVNADGIIDLNLAAKQANPRHKDIFVEVDFMAPYQPAASTLRNVESAFANVSNDLVNNPDGNRGINLHTELDPTDVVFARPWAADPWPEFQIEKVIHFGTTAERASLNWENILEAKSLVYRYCIFADRFPVPGLNGTTFPSGNARVLPGNPGFDFFVSLGAFNPSEQGPSQQAGTFMHELGHTLGLRHGGGDEDQFKPNYYSVMNYLFQLPQNIIPRTWRLGYSVAQLPSLFEPQLNEAQGLNPPPGLFPDVKIPYIRPDGTVRLTRLKPNTAVDWDGDGDSTTISSQPVDINHFNPASNPATPGDELAGYADWPNLQYNFRNTPGFPMTDRLDSNIQEMTPELYEYILSLPPYGIESPLFYWSSDPNINIPISTATVTQGTPLVAGDGEGGAYIAWNHGSGVPSTAGVYAQKVDAFGALQWMNNGIPLAVGPGTPTFPPSLRDFIADGEGNAIVTWVAQRTGSFDIMAQKINRFGQALWANNGVLIATAPTLPVGPNIVKTKTDGHGGATLVWADTHLGTVSFFAQKVDSSGAVRWNPGGVLVNTTLYNSGEFEIASDGFGGVIMTWTDKRNGGIGDIYAQRVSPTGVARWTTNGVRICDASGHQGSAVLVSNGVGGAIVTWVNYRVGGNDIYAQQVDSSGQTIWTTNGIAVVSVAGAKTFCGIVTDGSHGAILSWLDERRIGGYRDAYAQRIDSAGIPRWSTNGVAISDTTLKCFESTIMSDNQQGAMIILARQNVFQDNKLNIVAQRIDSTGSILWARNGVPITLANTPQPFQGVSTTSDLAGGAIIAWMDGRTDTFGSGVRHIYAQNVSSRGTLGGGGITTGVNEPRTDGVPSQVNLDQNYPNPFNPRTTIRFALPKAARVSLKVYDILGREVATLLDGFSEAGEKSVEFKASHLASGVYFYRLMAGDFVETKKLVLLK